MTGGMSTESETQTIPCVSEAESADAAGGDDAAAESPFQDAFEQAMADIAARHERSVDALVDIAA